MPNYQNGMIYEITPLNGESNHERYIGSTTKVSPVERFLIHKKKYNNYKNGSNCYMKSFELFDKYGVNNCHIFPIDIYECDSNNELQARKRFYLKTLPCINSIK